MEKRTIKPGKDIVASMVPNFKKNLYDLILENDVKEIEIDLEGVEMVDSVGLGAFIATHNTLSQNGGTLTVINASNDIVGLFKTMRLDQHFTVKGV